MPKEPKPLFVVNDPDAQSFSINFRDSRHLQLALDVLTKNNFDVFTQKIDKGRSLWVRTE